MFRRTPISTLMRRSRLLVCGLALGLSCIPLHAQDGGIESLRQTGKAFAAVARKVSPAVVYIQVESRRDAPGYADGQGFPFGDDLFRRFFGDNFPGFTPHAQVPRTAVSQGSGFVFGHGKEAVSYILTNNHVVENAERIHVKVLDGREFDARVKGTDPKSDVAVLEVDAADLPALAWGDSTQLDVGEWVVAIGNPFGLSHTLTVGVVSAKGRSSLGINDYEDFIQTDAAINPGNSGGPLVNLDGEVVGMNTAIFSRSGGYMGVGFAIPSNLARAMAEQLIAHGHVMRGYLGVAVQPLTREIAESLGLSSAQGILVAQVDADSPAARAGLKPGDVLQNFAGTPLENGGQYRNLAALAHPGGTISLGIVRNGRKKTLTVTVGSLDAAEDAAATANAEDLGVTVRSPTSEQIARLRLKPGIGVIVSAVDPASVAAQVGIQPGTVILEVNRETVTSPAEFVRALKKPTPDSRVLLRISENGRSRFVMLTWR